MKTIALTQGQVAIVDDGDFYWLNQWKWHAQWNKDTRSFYARCVAIVDGIRYLISMHRLLVTDNMKLDVDHINRVTLDNRRSNLRACSRTGNARNVGLRRNNTSGFKGVHLDKRTGRWESRLTIGSRKKHIGNHATAAEAALAYDVAALERYGEFAVTNAQLGLL